MKKILLTGGGGFIGSHLTDALLNDSRIALVRVLDNFSTGNKTNLAHHSGKPAFELFEGDIRDFDTCMQACEGIDLVCHQAALGSVPRSIADPLTTHAVNNTGMLHVLHAAKTQGIKRLVYAASSSTYGDHPDLPKKEDKIGKPLSPYAVTKYANELYASVYMRNYGMEVVGLRYFNVFGPRQSPIGAYAAAIPLFIQHLLQKQSATIHGDGSTSRDFTFVENAVQANMLALFTQNPDAFGEVFNVACGVQTSLNELYNHLQGLTGVDIAPVYGPERTGDIRHSLADISKAREILGYTPKVQILEGLQKTVEWFNGQT